MNAAPRQRAKALTLPAILDTGNERKLPDSLVTAAPAGDGRRVDMCPFQAFEDVSGALGLWGRPNERGAANG
jgi:hypothetical protein